MKLATAPTFGLSRRSAATSAPASKSFVWMRTGISASRYRREKSDLVARLHGRRRLGHFLVDGNAQGLALGKYRLPCSAAGHEQRAQARQVKDLDLHRYSSEYGMNLTMSPTRMGCSAGLSTRPSAQAVDISTAESWVG